MNESGETEHTHGYKCPSCGAIGGHMRTRFGPTGDVKNLERYCRKCSKRFITAHTEFVDLEYNREHSESFCPECGSQSFVQRPKAEDECLVCPYTEQETNPPVSETQKQQPDVSPDAWLFHYDISNCAVSGDHKELAVKNPMTGLYDGSNVEGDNCAEYLKNQRLYSSETIQEIIQKVLQKYQDGKTPFDSYERAALRPFANELEEVFSE